MPAMMSAEERMMLLLAQQGGTPGMMNQSTAGALSPEQLAALDFDFTGKEAKAKRQSMRAKAMRSKGGAQGIQVGDIYHASSPLSGLVQGMEGYMASKMAAKSDKGYEDISTARTAQREAQRAQDLLTRDEEREHQLGLTEAAQAFKIAQAEKLSEERGLVQTYNRGRDTAQDTLAEEALGYSRGQDVTKAGIAEEALGYSRGQDVEAETVRAEALEHARTTLTGHTTLFKNGQPVRIAYLDGRAVNPNTLERVDTTGMTEKEPKEGVNYTGLNDNQAKAVSALGSANERKYARTNITTANAFNDIIKDGNKMLEAGGGYSGWEDMAVGAAETMVPKAFEKMARTKAAGLAYDEDELKIRGEIGNAWEQLRRARTGANLTAIETELGEKYDPTADGLSLDESLGRMEYILDWMNTDFGVYGIDPIPVTRKWTPEEDLGERPANMTPAEWEEYKELRGEFGD